MTWRRVACLPPAVVAIAASVQLLQTGQENVSSSGGLVAGALSAAAVMMSLPAGERLNFLSKNDSSGRGDSPEDL